MDEAVIIKFSMEKNLIISKICYVSLNASLKKDCIVHTYICSPPLQIFFSSVNNLHLHEFKFVFVILPINLILLFNLIINLKKKTSLNLCHM